MDDLLTRLLTDHRGAVSRRTLLQTLGVAAAARPLAAFAQGRCMLTFGSPACSTADIAPVFAPTGWKTTSLDHLTFRVADYKKEAAFYIALMGWTLRSDDGRQAVLDMGDWGSAIFRQADASSFEAAGRGAAGGGGRGGPVHAVVESFCFDIAPWNAKTVEAELRKRGMTPVPETRPDGFESFHVKDPDGWDLQISNGQGLTRARKTAKAAATLSEPAPFAPTGWKTVWLDHLSFGVTNYKESASFYANLLGWKPTYDEGSQNEMMIGEVGDAIIRGGNPLDPNFGKPVARGRGGDAGEVPPAPAPAPGAPARSARIDHISFGISPWDTDGVKAELEKRGLRAQIDTSSKHLGPDGTYVPDEIHTAAFKSYHTITPNGYNLQISYVTHDNRLALANAVRPKPTTEKAGR